MDWQKLYPLMRILVVIGVVAFIACGSSVPVALREQSGVCDVALSFWLRKGFFNPKAGAPEVGWKLTLVNRSGEDLTDCLLIMNNRFELPLEEAAVIFAKNQDFRRFGRSTLYKGEKVVIGYSSDGGCIFVDDEGNILDYFTVPTRFTLKTKKCTRTWDLLSGK